MADLTLIPKASMQSVAALKDAFALCKSELLQVGDDQMTCAIATARAIKTLRHALSDDLMQDIMALQGSQLGFKVDKEYPLPKVRDVFITAQLRGARPVGNEFNIIAGNMYLTREYWERVFRELPGVSHVEPPVLGTPRYLTVTGKEYAQIQAVLRFKLDGKPQEFKRDGDAAILVPAGGAVDTVHGKAKARLFKMAHSYVTGIPEKDDEPEVPTFESPAGFHQTVHIEDQATYSVADGHADAATDVEPAEFSPEAEFAQAIRDSKSEAAAKAAAQAADEAGFPMPKLLADKLEAMRVNKQGRPKQKEMV